MSQKSDAKQIEYENKFIHFLENKIFPHLIKLNQIKFLDAIKESVIYSLPCIVIAFICFYFLVFTSGETKFRLIKAFSVSLGTMALWVSFYLPIAYSRKKKLVPAICSGIISFLTFLLTMMPLRFSINRIADKFELLSRGGIIIGIFVGGLFISTDKFLKDKNPARWIISKFLVFSAFLIISYSLLAVNKNIFQIFDSFIRPLLSGADSIPAAITIVLLSCLFWLAGVHGSGVMGGFIIPIYIVLFNANLQAYNNGLPLPYVIVPSFFVWAAIGGAGSTLPLCLFMLFSKVKHLRNVAKISILPSIFNLNEPLIYGLPIVMNPLLAVPFVLTPVVLVIVNYLALYFRLVHRIFIYPIYTMPLPVHAYLATLDWRAPLLIFIDFLIASAIYFPFFRLLERVELKKEKEEN
ncbi:MAG: PTS sugar transporter subunit IIC [Vulcanimicrobiota bacterium]